MLIRFKTFISRPNKNEKIKPKHQNPSKLIGNLDVFIFENSSFVVHFTLDQTGLQVNTSITGYRLIQADDERSCKYELR